MLKKFIIILGLVTSILAQSATAESAYNVWDPKLGKTVIFYVSEEDGFSKSYLRKAYKKQGLTPSKSDLENSEYQDLQGLMNANEKTVLPSIYEKVIPVSSRYALVQLFDGSYRIADLKSKKLSPAPSGSYYNLRRFSDEIDLVFIRTDSDARDEEIRDYRLLMPDATLGMLIENVDDTGDTWGIQVIGTNIFARTKDPETGVIGSLRADFRASEMKKGPVIKTFKVVESPFPDKRDAVVSSTVMDIGKSPVDLGSGNDRLYWPIGKDGNIVDRPANVVGMMPFSYAEFFDEAAGWLFVLVDDTGYDFKIAAKPYDGYADQVLSNLGEYLLFDDVRVYFEDDVYQVYAGKYHSIMGGYAVKVKHGQHGGKWFGFTYDGNGSEYYQVSHTGNDFYPRDANIARNTPNEAIVASVDVHSDDYQRILDGIEAAVKQDAERQENNSAAIARFLSVYVTTSVGNCGRLQLYARDVSYPSANDWTALFQTTGAVACNYVPLELASGFSEFMSGGDVTTTADAMSAYTRRVIEKGNVVKHWDCRNNPDGTATCSWVDR